MAYIQPIVNGEDMSSVLDKINQLIASYNATFPITKSYMDLTDKPAISGVELLPTTQMEEISVPTASLPNGTDLQQMFMEEAALNAELVARQVAQEEIANSTQLDNIPEAQNIVADDWQVLVYIPQQDGTKSLFKSTMKDITNKAVWASNNFEASVDTNTIIAE